MSAWHRWFAWYPVMVAGRWCWLSGVWRQRRMDHFDDPYCVYRMVEPEGGE